MSKGLQTLLRSSSRLYINKDRGRANILPHKGLVMGLLIPAFLRTPVLTKSRMVTVHLKEKSRWSMNKIFSIAWIS